LTEFSSQVGVLLFNTEKSPDPDGPGMTEDPLPVSKNCAILIPMQQIEDETIRYVKNLGKSDDFMGFDDKFGHSVDAKISDVLWLCSTMFSNCGKKIHIPQIFWFTSEDAPHKAGSAEHSQAFQKAKDLQQFQLDFQIFPMKENFNGDLFYRELLAQVLDIDVEDFPFPAPEFNEKVLLRRLVRQGYRRRALGYLNVELSDKAKFGVGIYSFARKSVIPKPTKIARDTNEQIIAKRSYKYADIVEGNDGIVDDVETKLEYNKTLEPAMAVKYQLVGDEKILFTPREAFEIKQLMEPKIKILGFKPSSVIADRHHVKSPYFIYPSDNSIKNSTVLFRTLWERCLSQNKVVICVFSMRLRATPRLAALVPQEQAEEDGEVYRYDGFQTGKYRWRCHRAHEEDRWSSAHQVQSLHVRQSLHQTNLREDRGAALR
jgi:ATP-dependent DNA helicase 2 subunit 1